MQNDCCEEKREVGRCGDAAALYEYEYRYSYAGSPRIARAARSILSAVARPEPSARSLVAAQSPTSETAMDRHRKSSGVSSDPSLALCLLLLLLL